MNGAAESCRQGRATGAPSPSIQDLALSISNYEPGGVDAPSLSANGRFESSLHGQIHALADTGQHAHKCVRPKQPSLDWAAQLDDSGLVPEIEGEQTVYLIPQFDDDDEAQKVLERVFAEVFDHELFGWHTDETAWPRKRTLALFREWFTVELHSVVEDLCDYELVDDEDQSAGR